MAALASNYEHIDHLRNACGTYLAVGTLQYGLNFLDCVFVLNDQLYLWS
jgi:translation initiation factor 6 (eIF-6)